MSQVWCSRFRNSSPWQVEVSETRWSMWDKIEQIAWVLILVKIQKGCRWSKHIQFGGTEIALKKQWHLVVSRVFVTEVEWLKNEDNFDEVWITFQKQEAMFTVSYTKQLNESKKKVQDGYKSEKWICVWREIQWGLRGYCFQVESCLYKCCSAHLPMFFGFRWSSVTGSDEFLKSSQCVASLGVLLISLQQLMGFMLILCSNKKVKRAKWSVYMRMWSAVTSRQNQREKQFLGGAIFQWGSCLIRVWSSST